MKAVLEFLENFGSELSVVILEDNKYEVQNCSMKKENLIHELKKYDFEFTGAGETEFYIISAAVGNLTFQVSNFEFETELNIALAQYA